MLYRVSVATSTGTEVVATCCSLDTTVKKRSVASKRAGGISGGISSGMRMSPLAFDVRGKDQSFGTSNVYFYLVRTNDATMTDILYT